MTGPELQHRVVVVGLGPGGEEFVSSQAREAIDAHPARFTLAPDHPAMSLVPDAAIIRQNSSDLQGIAQALLDAASVVGTGVLLAVPGSPLVQEPVVAFLLTHHRETTRVVPGLSFLDVLWPALGVDPFQGGTRVVEAGVVTSDLVGAGPLVITDLDPDGLKACAGLTGVPMNTDVAVVRRVGLPGESIEWTVWSELPKVGLVEGLSSLYVGAPELAFTPRSALREATSVQCRGAGLGFGLPDLAAAFADVEDELAEVREEPSAAEAGDLLFAAVQVARHLGVDPEEALRGAVQRFAGRLEYIVGCGADLRSAGKEDLKLLWTRAKAEVG
ncbi:SAM-dependent methyltransferase [Streptomyces sp. bgisy034]|uniref:SAM-dependent methyltransferase n=1 Tax=Streptomyces sp. bgisy034 TaxID=3413774 RepID=UPI003EB95024